MIKRAALKPIKFWQDTTNIALNYSSYIIKYLLDIPTDLTYHS